MAGHVRIAGIRVKYRGVVLIVQVDKGIPGERQIRRETIHKRKIGHTLARLQRPENHYGIFERI
jgi:hypothetical protein